MAELQEILEHLNVDLPEGKRLRKGKKHENKNRYYYFKDHYYIVSLTRDKWMILDDSKKSRELLRKHTWCYGNGYAKTHADGSTKRYHQLALHYENHLVVDHINRCRFDNRSDNLRVATPQQNQRNIKKQCNNTSGTTGVCKRKNGGYEYWVAHIRNDEGKNMCKYFSIKKYGNKKAKRLAIQKRQEWEEEFGYDGE
jgi:hypothetical protein